MKNLFTCLLAFMLVFQVAAQGKVEFFQGTWQEAFAKAEKEDKHVFVDSYTDWCYWCKVMDKETFTDQAIADYLNAEFVPIKVDMEKGFGVDVAMKFRVRGFPTLLYFNPGGQILAKVPGYEQDKGKFLDHLKKIRADRREQPYGFASQDFDVDYPDFVEGVFARNGKRERTDAATVDAWLDGQKDLYSEQAWTALTQCPTGEKYKTQVLENGEKYAAKYGAEEFNDFVVSTVYGKVSKAGKEKSKEQYDAAITMLNTYMTDEEGKKDMAENFEFSYLKATEDWRGYTMKADEKLKTQSLDEQLGFANSVAWTLYEKCEDKECLKMMEKWMNKVIEMDPQYMYIDTYAALLYKNGDLAEAKKYAEKAIEVGKTDDSNTEETAALLVKIEEGIRDSK